MAKGNMFQGMARGKVGDVVFSRLDGQQISRVRNRNPKNPRTNAQLYQRAIMASVMAFYSAGKEIFDHSFEGYSKGAENQRRFLSENARLLRSAIASAIEAEYENVTVPNVTAPGVQTVVFNNWKISEGTYPMQAFGTYTAGDSFGFILKYPMDDLSPAALAEKNGLIPDDLYTFVICKQITSQKLFQARASDYMPDRLFSTAFGFVRLRVRNDLASTGTASTLADLFTAEMSSNVSSNILQNAINENIDRSTFQVGGNLADIGMIGLIRSREDEDLRSTSYMKYSEDSLSTSQGLHCGLLLPVWKAGVQSLGNSELILEGGDF